MSNHSSNSHPVKLGNLIQNLETLSQTVKTIKQEVDDKYSRTRSIDDKRERNEELKASIVLMKEYAELMEEHANLEAQILEIQLVRAKRLAEIRERYKSYVVVEDEVNGVPLPSVVQGVPPPGVPPAPPPPQLKKRLNQ